MRYGLRCEGVSRYVCVHGCDLGLCVDDFRAVDELAIADGYAIEGLGVLVEINTGGEWEAYVGGWVDVLKHCCGDGYEVGRQGGVGLRPPG